MSMIQPVVGAGVLQRKCDCGNHTISGECDDCAKKRNSLQRQFRGGLESAQVPQIVHDVLRSPGHPLDYGTRALLEPKLGTALGQSAATPISTLPQRMAISQPGDCYEREADRIAEKVLTSNNVARSERGEKSSERRYDLSHVRVHTDSQASESARAVNALAYTVGQHVVFAGGSYSPHTAPGLRLLTHELAHTAQQAPVLGRKQAAACLSSAECEGLTTPSVTLSTAQQESKTRRSEREKLCNRKVPDPGCSADKHGARAVQLEALLRNFNPTYMATTQGIFIDRDLEKDFRALTIFCNNFTPPIAKTGHCITVPIESEQEAEQFNTTKGHRIIDGKEAGYWRERMLEIVIHEAEHTRFRTIISPTSSLVPGGAPILFGKKRPTCTRKEEGQQDVHSAMNELSSMVQEFRLRRKFLKATVGFSAAEKEADMEDWRDFRIRRDRQSIKVSLKTARCFCGCDDANDLIRETLKFATASWTNQEVLDLDLEMTHHRWSDLNLNWPSGPTSQKTVPDRMLPEGEEMG